ncbi:MAG: hypothetical protein KF881_07790 [Acidobacteria bacterium]|nr:hypothetical protein [Acidobacteriota bacterium]
MDIFEQIAENSKLVIKTFPDADLGFDRDSVAWIDGYIERNRDNWDEETRYSLASVFGSFLGECICRNLGAFWEQDDLGIAVVFGDGNKAFPFNKTAKQIANGSDDSILSFYDSAEQLFCN